MRSSGQFLEVPVERVQEYWDARPCNIRHSPRPVGSEEYFNEVEFRNYRVEPHIPDVAEFERWRGKRVLEIGCGIGADTINFARHGAAVTAVDLSEKSLAVARQRAEVFGLSDRINFVRVDAEELDRALHSAPSYDLVYSFGVIHHTPNPDRVLGQIRKQLKPGGELKVMVYNRRSWKVLWIVVALVKGRFWKADELIAQHSEAQTGCPVTYSYSRQSGRDWLEQAGFKVTRITVDHIFPYRIPDYLQYRYVKVWCFRWIPRRVFHWLEKRLGWHLLLSAEAPR